MTKNAGESCTENPVYSYHRFIYPFIYKQKLDTVISDNKKWQEDVIVENENSLFIQDDKMTKKLKWDYACFQYFNKSARKALLVSGKNVNCYKYKLDTGCTYEIKVKTEDNPFVLNLTGVKLKLYPGTSIGILMYETEYRPDFNLTEEEKRRIVKSINEYGRRIYPEFIPEYENSYFLCAESISIKSDKRSIVDNFWERSFNKDGSLPEYIRKPALIPNIVKEILGCTDDLIESAIDDRMFSCCVIRDKKLVDYFRESPSYLENTNKAKELYAIINCDPANSRCQDADMVEECLKKQLYKRWYDYGTIYAFTNHSMVCLTSEDSRQNDVVVGPFLTEYIQMCILVIVQRASLIAFDVKINEAVKDEDKTEKLIEEFTHFQGQIMIPEVTSQIQGIEIYRKLQKMLFIKELESDLQLQIQNLFEIRESQKASRQQRADNILGAIGGAIGIIAISSACIDLYDFMLTFSNDKHPWFLSWVSLGVNLAAAFAFALGAFHIIKWLVNRKDKNKK